MELRAGPAEGDEDLGCDEEDRHGGLEPELAPEEAQPEGHRDEADAEAGNQVHGEGGQERDAQRAHGGGAHAFGGRGHLAATLALPAERAQGGQALDQLEEAPGERAEAAPLARRTPRRLATEEHHRQWHGEHQRDDDEEGQPVLRRDPGQ